MKKLLKMFKFTALAGVLPFIYGCGSGGGGESVSALSDFLHGSSSLASMGVEESSALLLASEVELATMHQPEPASMLLLGGGLIATAYMSRRKKK